MIKCERCKCLCDPGDLVNGVCDDCREEEQREQEQKQKMGADAEWGFPTNGVERILMQKQICK